MYCDVYIAQAVLGLLLLYIRNKSTVTVPMDSLSFKPISFHVGSATKEVALEGGGGIFPVVRLYPNNIIPLMFHSHSFTCH